MSGARSADLTGVWLGLYSYPRKLEPVSFTATLIDTSGAISGSSHEAFPRGRDAPHTVFAALWGRRDEHEVAAVKAYDDGIPHNKPISYEGTIVDDGNEIAGRWIIPRVWSGRFLMVRSAPNAEAIVRRKYERIRI